MRRHKTTISGLLLHIAREYLHVELLLNFHHDEEFKKKNQVKKILWFLLFAREYLNVELLLGFHHNEDFKKKIKSKKVLELLFFATSNVLNAIFFQMQRVHLFKRVI